MVTDPELASHIAAEVREQLADREPLTSTELAWISAIANSARTLIYSADHVPREEALRYAAHLLCRAGLESLTGRMGASS